MVIENTYGFQPFPAQPLLQSIQSIEWDQTPQSNLLILTIECLLLPESCIWLGVGRDFPYFLHIWP